ncbi:unnamed protein product [Phytomonas sp. Hart1]|nr:unnamed protein product [Phytomonas sp. Hart1]|eukprot:CCW71394.1 unnamed protein product [Phytomonas sp. isolate Hart1]
MRNSFNSFPFLSKYITTSAVTFSDCVIYKSKRLEFLRGLVKSLLVKILLTRLSSTTTVGVAIRTVSVGQLD